MPYIFEWRLLKPRFNSFNFRFSPTLVYSGNHEYLLRNDCFVIIPEHTLFLSNTTYDWRSFTTSTDTGLIWEVCERFFNRWDNSSKTLSNRLRNQHLSKVVSGDANMSMWTHGRHSCGDLNQNSSFVVNIQSGFRYLSFLRDEWCSGVNCS